jgi:hypothetical protein
VQSAFELAKEEDECMDMVTVLSCFQNIFLKVNSQSLLTI